MGKPTHETETTADANVLAQVVKAAPCYAQCEVLCLDYLWLLPELVLVGFCSWFLVDFWL